MNIGEVMTVTGLHQLERITDFKIQILGQGINNLSKKDERIIDKLNLLYGITERKLKNEL